MAMFNLVGKSMLQYGVNALNARGPHYGINYQLKSEILFPSFYLKINFKCIYLTLPNKKATNKTSNKRKTHELAMHCN